MQAAERAIKVARALQQLITDDAVGQLRRRDGRMAQLGSENGEPKLDWVEGVARLLDDTTALELVEAEARAIWQRGIRHVLWAGMGGSVLTIHVLTNLGFCRSDDGHGIALYPLDSTDPAALNEIMRRIARVKRMSLSKESTPAFLRVLLEDVMMIGVSMGMTSEEPITHLAWFTDLLVRAGLDPADHLLVMTLPGSYLDQFAHERAAPSLPLQLDSGTGTGGRMSAPTTRVFLLPAALSSVHHTGHLGMLREVMRRAWAVYDLRLATEHPERHPYVQLAAALSAASEDGVCRLLINMPAGWQVLTQWIEQLMEESLGKGGKGVVVFADQPLNTQAPNYHPDGLLRVHVVTDAASERGDDGYALIQPSLASSGPLDKLVAVAASFLGWQLTMALYGYLHHIPFAGQPAVENYKARARMLRTQRDPLATLHNWNAMITDGPLTLFVPQQSVTHEVSSMMGSAPNAAAVFATALVGSDQMHAPADRLGYLDLTLNGEPLHERWTHIHAHFLHIGNRLLGIPVKLRRAPAAYHSTEQSEMDGPPFLVSLRLLTHGHERSVLGIYDDTFLRAQAVSTWQAMLEQGRLCFLLLIDESANDPLEPLHHFLQQVQLSIKNTRG